MMDFRIKTPHKGRESRMTFGLSLAERMEPARMSTNTAALSRLILSSRKNNRRDDAPRKILRFDDEPEVHHIPEVRKLL